MKTKAIPARDVTVGQRLAAVPSSHLRRRRGIWPTVTDHAYLEDGEGGQPTVYVESHEHPGSTWCIDPTATVTVVIEDTCQTKHVSDIPGRPALACDKADRFHLVHRDPVTGIRYMPYPPGRIFDFCGLIKHRGDCPLRHDRAEVQARRRVSRVRQDPGQRLMGIFDGDPKFEALKELREIEGYDGPID
jgi:hypothetical protein